MLNQLTIIKLVKGDITHYIGTKNNNVITSIELNKTPTGHYWVRHSVSDVSNQGVGKAMYKLAMSDLYPYGIMPSREVTSGNAVNLWESLWKDQSIKKKVIKEKSIYMEEADEWLLEIKKVNPDLTCDDIEKLAQDFSYIDSVKQNKMIPHPYNHTYSTSIPNKQTIKSATKNNQHLFKDAENLFYQRYETLDL